MYQRYSEFPLPFTLLSASRSHINTEISNILANLLHDMSCQVLRQLNHPIVYSLSPGTSVTPAMAKDVSSLVNMYRITGDDWDTWDDVKAHFGVTRQVVGLLKVLTKILKESVGKGV
ncbi:hypothetical protein RIF29_00795 [Crotalaria pallida]|uniref:Uncharacterized protein n=1 Tax=Crotalaria pallida TaxID=3830 RepID=A0AAN9IY01_CROPI